MSAFLTLVIKSCRRMSVYSINVLTFMLAGAILLVIQASIWQALYGQGIQAAATYSETLTYIVIYNTVLQVLDLKIGTTIGRSVYNGTIGEDLLRPINLQLLHISSEAGAALFNFMAYSLPLLVIALAFYPVLPPASLYAFLAFLLTVVLGRVIAGLINCIIGYSAFWLMNNWFMVYFERALMVLFGGTLVPLWFYPDWLSSVTGFLPFQYVNFLALDLYLGRTPLY